MKLSITYIGLLLIFSSCGEYFSNNGMTEIPRKQQSFRTGILSYLDDQIERNPEQVNLYVEKAQYFKEDGWPNEALPVLNQAIELDSNNWEAFKLRASYFISKDRFKDALNDINFLEMKGIVTDELINGKIYAYYGQQELVDFFRTAVGYSSKLNSVNRQNLADYFLNSGDSLLAIRYAYLNYLNKSSDKKQTMSLVNLLLEEGFSEKSFQILENFDADDPETELARATILMNMGDEQRSSKIFKDLMKNGSLPALLKMNEFYLSTNKPDSAIFQNDRFLERYDSSLVVLKKQAKLFQNKYKWRKSLEYLNIVIKKDPSDKEALLEASKVRGKIAYLRSLKAKRDSIPRD